MPADQQPIEMTPSPRPPKVILMVGPEGKVVQAVILEADTYVDYEQVQEFADLIENDATVLALPHWWDHEFRTVPNEDQATKALRTLVALKDGPRDDTYELAKDDAWEAARTALFGEFYKSVVVKTDG